MSLSRLRQSLNSAAPAYLALSCFGLASPALAQAQETPKETNPTRLGGMTVTDTVIDEPTIKADRVASPKFTQRLQDTPQTIQVITKELFNEQGATTLTEALRNSPGVGTFGAGENGNTTTGDALYMRGFDTSNSIFVDGIRDLGAISRDIFNTEQIEVTKGPAGTDNGRSAPSGSINMVSKQASGANALSGLASVGIDGQKRVTFDINQTLGSIPNAAFRLNALWQDSDVVGRDHVNNKRIGIAPSFGFGIDTPTRIWANFLYVKQDNVPDGGVPIEGVPGWTPKGSTAAFGYFTNNPLPTSNFYGTRADHDNVEAYMATLRFEHDFSDTMKLTNIARWGRTTENYLITSFMAPLTNGSTNPADWTISRNNNTLDTVNDILTDQLNLRADFATGAIEHNLSVGLEITRERQTNYRVLVSGTRPAANLLNPDWTQDGTIGLSRNPLSPVISRGQTDTQSFYAFDTAKLFDDKLLITGGVRFDHYRTHYRATAACAAVGTATVPACGTAAVGSFLPSADLTARDTLFNWKIGAVYKPVTNLSFYVNYALSQQPPGGANFTLSATAGANSPNFQPQKAKTIEAGVKWSALGDRLALNAAIFKTTVSNEVFTDPTDLANLQAGTKSVKGVELSAVGNITEAWSISAGYSHLKSKIDIGAAAAADGSLNLLYTPGDSFTLYTTYKLPFGLELGGGVNYNGGLHKATDGGGDPNGVPFETKGYTIANATVAYALTSNIKLRVNATNLFDKDYIAAINKSGWRYRPGVPRTVLFTADFRF
jgi:catecholate siderophore receptor